MSLSSLNSIGQTVFELESGNENVDGQVDRQMDGQTNRRTELHQFRKEPSYDGDLSPLSSLNLIGQTVFELVSGNENVDGQMDGQANERTELHQFQQEPSYDGDLSPCQV